MVDSGVLMYCYTLPPIDYWWGAVSKESICEVVRDFFHDLGQEDGGEPAARQESWRVSQELDKLVAWASAAFLQMWWEGDCTSGTPLFFGIPAEGSMAIGCIIKQGNNGTTFVASPHPLPHLDSLAFKFNVLRFGEQD